jgi:EAL and modified HD-GYP domain-containing signal transduction protein
MGTMEVFVARQPIFGRDRYLHAYELLFRSSAVSSEFDAAESGQATMAVIANSLFGIGLDRLLRGKVAFVNFGREMLLQDWHTALPQETVIEVLETVAPDADVLMACRRIRQQGYRIALDDFVLQPGFDSFLDVADIVKIDVRAAPLAEQRELIAACRARKLPILAEKVETHEEYESAMRAGFGLFQGYFFARPVLLAAQRIPATKLNCLRLLEEVHRPEMEFDHVTGLIAKDVSFSYNLLRFVNSGLFARRTPVRTVREALWIIGEDGIRKWVSLAALPALAEDRSPELVTHSLVRGRFCESMARTVEPSLEEHAFLTGIFSLLDAMLARPLADILAEISVAQPVAMALLRTHPERNQLSAIYELILCYEAALWPATDRLIERLGVTAPAVREAYCEAVHWADQVIEGHVAESREAPLKA